MTNILTNVHDIYRTCWCLMNKDQDRGFQELKQNANQDGNQPEIKYVNKYNY